MYQASPRGGRDLGTRLGGHAVTRRTWKNHKPVEIRGWAIVWVWGLAWNNTVLMSLPNHSMLSGTVYQGSCKIHSRLVTVRHYRQSLWIVHANHTILRLHTITWGNYAISRLATQSRDWNVISGFWAQYDAIDLGIVQFSDCTSINILSSWYFYNSIFLFPCYAISRYIAWFRCYYMVSGTIVPTVGFN